MILNLERCGPNVHVARAQDRQKLLLISDLHWDNPHCDRELLKNHLDEAVRRDAAILVNGDFFCLMQGKGDPRRSKDDIRPEHNNGRYLDSVVETAVEWFKPYANHIALIGYGNHETGVLKHQETDILRRFADLLNFQNGTNVQVGGYGGVFSVIIDPEKGKNHQRQYVIHYFHGSGGGGVVTKGVIQDQRIMASVEGYNCTWQGHVHELYHHTNMIHRYDPYSRKIVQKYVDQVRTSTYKEEWDGGVGGFHVEKGRAPKPLGGYWLDLELIRFRKAKEGVDESQIIAGFTTCTRIY
jgi:hypothetical protein